MVDNLLIYLQNKHNLTQHNIISIFRTGGTLLCTSCKDTDYTVIVDDTKTMQHFWRDATDNTEYFIMNIANREKLLSLSQPYNVLQLFILDEVFKPQTTIYGSATCNLDLFAHKEAYLEMLKDQVPKTFTHQCLHWKDRDKYCHRKLWWVILGLTFIENNSYEVSPELREIVQKCHDGILEKEWEEWVLDKINIKK